MPSLWNKIRNFLVLRQPVRRPSSLGKLARSLSIVIGVVLIWRGIWLLLDELDKFLFGTSHFWTALLGIIIGLLILYLPDGDLDELGKL